MRALTSLLENACRKGFHIKSDAGDLDAAAVDVMSRALAGELKARGASASEPALILCGNNAHDIAAFFGVWRAGLVAVPLHESAPTEVISQMKNALAARFVIKKCSVEGCSGNLSAREVPPDTALIIFTSGSTGQPKGVMLGHARLAAKMEVLQKLLQFRSDDVAVVPLQLTFVFGIWVSFIALMAGATVILLPKFSASGMAKLIDSGATIIGVVPTMLRSMQLDPPPAAGALRSILTGGEPFLSALAGKVSAAFPQAEIFDLYGSTETGSCDFYLNVSKSSELGTIGCPTSGVQYKIVGDDESEIHTNAIGELRISTHYGMLGYFNDPAATAAAFDANEYFRTGDLGRRRGSGLVELAGRRKEIISRGGIKISPLEIDSLFATHPDVDAALCGGIPDSRLGETIHLLIVKRAGANLNSEILHDWAVSRIEKQKLPDVIHFVTALPLGRTGKADRTSVKRIALKR